MRYGNECLPCCFCSLFSSLFNGKLFRMNSKFNKKTSRKCYRQKTGIYLFLLRNNGHLCYTVENSDVFTHKKTFFGVAFNRCLKDTIFLCGLLFQKPTMASPNCKDQYLPKKRSRTNKGTAIKKTCLFSGLSKELHLT